MAGAAAGVAAAAAADGKTTEGGMTGANGAYYPAFMGCMRVLAAVLMLLGKDNDSS